MTEKALTNSILKFLEALPGCKAIKIHGGPFMRRGTPDIIGCYRGRGLAFEVKVDRPGNKPTLLQRLELEQWRDSGAIARVVTSLQEVQILIEDWDGLDGQTV